MKDPCPACKAAGEYIWNGPLEHCMKCGHLIPAPIESSTTIEDILGGSADKKPGHGVWNAGPVVNHYRLFVNGVSTPIAEVRARRAGKWRVKIFGSENVVGEDFDDLEMAKTQAVVHSRAVIRTLALFLEAPMAWRNKTSERCDWWGYDGESAQCIDTPTVRLEGRPLCEQHARLIRMKMERDT